MCEYVMCVSVGVFHHTDNVPNDKASLNMYRKTETREMCQFCTHSPVISSLALCCSDTLPLAISWHYVVGE